jgi:hypothetical protein
MISWNYSGAERAAYGEMEGPSTGFCWKLSIFVVTERTQRYIHQYAVGSADVTEADMDDREDPQKLHAVDWKSYRAGAGQSLLARLGEAKPSASALGSIR